MSIPGIKSDGFANRIVWDHGGGHVALRSVTSWASIQLGPSTQLCCFNSNSLVLNPRNEGKGPHHMQGHHTWGPWIGFEKLVI